MMTPAPRLPWPCATIAALMLAVALAVRWPLTGDPIAGVDEQFYLLVGDRMWAGALPYVDIWDRKPVGLFLLYAAFRALPGDGVLAYQLAGAVCLALTGWLVALIARRTVAWPVAVAAGVVAIALTTLMGQGLGEAPIFYDPLVAAAAWAVLRVRDGAGHSTAYGAAAMLACGIAITIKTVAAFEGMAFGLLLLAAHRRAGMPTRRLIGRALAYAAIGIAPTALAALYYAGMGHWADFWFANVTSILLRSGGGGEASLVQLVATLLLLGPLLLPAMLALRERQLPDDRPLLAAWAGATAIGLVAVGYFPFHYALPMIAPLAILAARGLPRRGGGAVLTVALGGAAWLAVAPSPVARDRADLAVLLGPLPPEVRSQCLLIREGPAITYHLSHACLAGRYAFPGHFTAAGEAEATGTPRARMTADALARRPAAIIDVADPPDAARLAAAGYAPCRRGSIRLYGAARVMLSVWVRRDLARFWLGKCQNLAPNPVAELKGSEA